LTDNLLYLENGMSIANMQLHTVYWTVTLQWPWPWPCKQPPRLGMQIHWQTASIHVHHRHLLFFCSTHLPSHRGW